jgi:hypothetical protein
MRNFNTHLKTIYLIISIGILGSAFAQSGQINVADFETPQEIDQSLKFNGNTVLRGGQIPRVDKNSIFIS